MSIIKTKLEFAQLSIQANRIDEAEKAIMDIIFDSTTDDDSLHTAWLNLGSIKVIKYLKNNSILNEVSYCYKKAYQIKSNNETLNPYLQSLVYILDSAKAIIDKSNENIIVLQKEAFRDSLIAAFSFVSLTDKNNSFFGNTISLIGLSYGINGVMENVNSIEGFKNLVNYLQNCINEVYENYTLGFELNKDQISYFESILKKNELQNLLPIQVQRNIINNESILNQNTKRDLLFEIFNEAISLNCNVIVKNKLLLNALINKVSTNSKNGLFSTSTTITHLESNLPILSKYVDTESSHFYFECYLKNKIKWNIFYTLSNIKIVTHETYIFNRPKNILNEYIFTYDELFDLNSEIFVPEEKALSQNPYIIITKDNVEFQIFNFNQGFKSSTIQNQYNLLKKAALLFNKNPGY